MWLLCHPGKAEVLLPMQGFDLLTIIINMYLLLVVNNLICLSFYALLSAWEKRTKIHV